MKIIIGGPSYQMLVDARHAGAMASLAVTITTRGHELAINYRHGCPVEHARNSLFGAALESGFDALWWADSDCFWPDWASREIVWLLEELVRRDLPFAAVPCPQRNGDSNLITHRDGARWERLRGSIAIERALKLCYAAGLGAAAFQLGWYRRHWPLGPWFRTDWEGANMVSEDFWHTRELSSRPGGAAHYSPIFQVTHAARGGL